MSAVAAAAVKDEVRKAEGAPSDPPKTTKKGGDAVIHYPFWFGGSASCFAATVTHPLDLIKVRLQTQVHGPGKPRLNMLQMFAHVAKTDGVAGLYRGLSASLLRQITYSTTRFGVYEELKEHFTTPHHPPSFLTLIGIASASGLLGGIAGNPADVLNVRMQHDAALPLAQRRNYRHALDGLLRMSRAEGPAALFRGVGPNSARAVLMTASQLASYDAFKRLLLTHLPPGLGLARADDPRIHFAASFAAGFVATTVCSPVDVIKTRVMSAHDPQGIWHLVTTVTRKEGLGWMFRGWMPSFIRLGPHTIFTFVFLEQHKRLYRRWKGVDPRVEERLEKGE